VTLPSPVVSVPTGDSGNVKRIAATLIILVSGLAAASAQESLGDVARKNRETKPDRTEARLVVDDESDRVKRKSVFPEIADKGLDNSSEIIKAMDIYLHTHPPDQGEKAIREWFEQYDELMANAIQQRQELLQRHRDRLRGVPGDHYRITNYRESQMKYEAEWRVDDDDYRRYEAAGLLTARIQQTFVKVRSFLELKNRRYEWFQIRFGNNNGSW